MLKCSCRVPPSAGPSEASNADQTDVYKVSACGRKACAAGSSQGGGPVKEGLKFKASRVWA